MIPQTWQPAGHQPPPAPGEIHVWRIDLANADLPDPISLLSPDERERAARLLIERKRVRFVAGRWALRKVLGQYLGIAPQALLFDYGPHGKPGLASAESATGFAFNFSHSEDLALLAVAHARTVGIDIEHRRRNISAAPFARHILSETEVTELLRLPVEKQNQALLAVWARKEAYLKALGVGLSHPMSGFTTGLSEEGKTLVRQLDDADGQSHPWTFIPLTAHPDYLACLAAPGHDWVVHRFDWQPANSIG